MPLANLAAISGDWKVFDIHMHNPDTAPAMQSGVEGTCCVHHLRNDTNFQSCERLPSQLLTVLPEKVSKIPKTDLRSCSQLRERIRVDAAKMTSGNDRPPPTSFGRPNVGKLIVNHVHVILKTPLDEWRHSRFWHALQDREINHQKVASIQPQMATLQTFHPCPAVCLPLGRMADGMTSVHSAPQLSIQQLWHPSLFLQVLNTPQWAPSTGQSHACDVAKSHFGHQLWSPVLCDRTPCHWEWWLLLLFHPTGLSGGMFDHIWDFCKLRQLDLPDLSCEPLQLWSRDLHEELCVEDNPHIMTILWNDPQPQFAPKRHIPWQPRSTATSPDVSRNRFARLVGLWTKSGVQNPFHYTAWFIGISLLLDY